MQEPIISLTKTIAEDLEELFRIQLDQEANYMAAFISGDPTDKTAYFEKFLRLIADPEIHMYTIHTAGKITGSIARFFMHGDAEITYWIDKDYWGQGIAGSALREFLKRETIRPLFGRTAFDNTGSQKVLEKNGFIQTGKDSGFANARQAEIEEYIYRLDL